MEVGLRVGLRVEVGLRVDLGTEEAKVRRGGGEEEEYNRCREHNEKCQPSLGWVPTKEAFTNGLAGFHF